MSIYCSLLFLKHSITNFMKSWILESCLDGWIAGSFGVFGFCLYGKNWYGCLVAFIFGMIGVIITFILKRKH